MYVFMCLANIDDEWCDIMNLFIKLNKFKIYLDNFF